MFWMTVSTLVAAIMATSVILVRIRIAEKPTSKIRIILPPIMMSTGALMFLFPVFRVGWMQAIEALVVGIIFSFFLIRTSKLEIRKRAIYLLPSKAFIFILFGLLIVRIVGKVIIGSQISVGETAGVFYLLGFGMIFTWRIAMLYKFYQLEKELHIKYAPK